ncbi:MAG: hypothetical protein AB7H96_07725 [Vicinamibacterales bacterium]
MVWIFEREGHRLRCEVTRNDANGTYRIVMAQAGGATTVEDIEQPQALIERTATVMRNLHEHGWRLA